MHFFLNYLRYLWFYEKAAWLKMNTRRIDEDEEEKKVSSVVVREIRSSFLLCFSPTSGRQKEEHREENSWYGRWKKFISANDKRTHISIIDFFLLCHQNLHNISSVLRQNFSLTNISPQSHILFSFKWKLQSYVMVWIEWWVSQGREIEAL